MASMKKIPTKVRHSLPPLKLYLDDLERVVALLKDDFNITSMETDRHELSDISDLAELDEKIIRQFSIKAKARDDETLTMDLAPNSAYLALSSKDSSVRGRFEDILDSLSARKNWSFYITLRIIYGCVVLAFITFPLDFTMLRDANLSVMFFVVGSPGFITLILLQTLKFRMSTQYTTIILAHRGTSPNLWQRNWDKLLFVAIGSAITLLLTWIFHLLTGSK
jgi:hypothetical protein